MRQWWSGRAVPMAGVASVRVAPEDRGRGIARRLMAAVLADVAARGYPLSVLYPATMPLYRSFGWELAGPDVYAYLCDDGFLVYGWHHGNHALFVDGAEAVSASTQRAFWSHIGSHASIADQVYACLSPSAAFWLLTRERDAQVHRRSMWMLRVVDAQAAIAARGFPAAVSATGGSPAADAVLDAAFAGTAYMLDSF